MCHKTGVIDLSLEIRCSDWLSLSGDMSQNRGHWPFASHLTQTSSIFVSLSPLGERMSLHFWFFCWFFFSLSYFLKFDVREWLVHCFQQWADWSDWESVTLHCWFSANSRSLKVREGYSASLIPSKWEFSQSERGLFCIVDSQQMGVFSRICADHKASATLCRLFWTMVDRVHDFMLIVIHFNPSRFNPSQSIHSSVEVFC